MIRTKATDWRVQTLDDNGRWVDHHAGHHAGPAIRAYQDLDTPKRLLRNGRAVDMTPPDELDLAI